MYIVHISYIKCRNVEESVFIFTVNRNVLNRSSKKQHFPINTIYVLGVAIQYTKSLRNFFLPLGYTTQLLGRIILSAPLGGGNESTMKIVIVLLRGVQLNITVKLGAYTE